MAIVAAAGLLLQWASENSVCSTWVQALHRFVRVICYEWLQPFLKSHNLWIIWVSLTIYPNPQLQQSQSLGRWRNRNPVLLLAGIELIFLWVAAPVNVLDLGRESCWHHTEVWVGAEQCLHRVRDFSAFSRLQGRLQGPGVATAGISDPAWPEGYPRHSPSSAHKLGGAAQGCLRGWPGRSLWAVSNCSGHLLFCVFKIFPPCC